MQCVICEGILVDQVCKNMCPQASSGPTSFIWSCDHCLRRCMSSNDSAKICLQEIRASEADAINTDLKHMCLEPQLRFSITHAKGLQPNTVPQRGWRTTGSLPSSLRALKRPAELWACTQSCASLIQKIYLPGFSRSWKFVPIDTQTFQIKIHFDKQFPKGRT